MIDIDDDDRPITTMITLIGWSICTRCSEKCNINWFCVCAFKKWRLRIH